MTKDEILTQIQHNNAAIRGYLQRIEKIKKQGLPVRDYLYQWIHDYAQTLEHNAQKLMDIVNENEKN